MHRWPSLYAFVTMELMAVADAMEDGTYWEDAPQHAEVNLQHTGPAFWD